MMLKIALLVVSLPLVALGGEGLYHAARNRQQTTITCEQFARETPRALWLRITDCEVDYMHAGYRDPGGHIREMYFPVRPQGWAATTPASLIVATRDPQALALAQQTIGDYKQPNQEAFVVMMLQIVTLLKASREVEGYGRTGIIQQVQTERALSGLSATLAKPFVVLDLNGQPTLLLPAVEAGIGLAALVGFVLLLRRRPKPAVFPEAKVAPDASSQAAPEQPITSPEAAELPEPWDIAEVLEPLTQIDLGAGTAAAEPQPAERAEPSFPTMLLLKLDRHAGVDAIEHAPALGTSDEVRAALREACDGIRFDDEGRGTFEGPGFRITIEIGPPTATPVWTGTVRARGPQAIAAVKALENRTGWRLFIPKHGVFLESVDPETVKL